MGGHSIKAPPAVADEGLALRWVDVVITTMGSIATLYLVLAGRWIPGWQASAVAFALMAVGAPLLRALARIPLLHRAADTAASFWLLPCAVVGHWAMRPIVDGFSPRLFDAQLAMADFRLFGASPAEVLSRLTPGWLNDLLLLCYYSYFLWSMALGVVLFRTARRSTFEHYTLALALIYSGNFLFYVLVPAVGPRFFLAQDFQGPLSGVLAPYLESLMRTPCFMKDCFPSGHTAVTLGVLTFAYRHARRFFWGMLPFGVGLIAATVVGRFHYGVDLLCAVPFVVAAVSLSTALARLNPHGVVVLAPGLQSRQPVRV